jgi:deoxyribodipyrimidine photolyase-related protein
VETHFADAPGTLNHFDWPVTPADAARELEDFVAHRLPHFGQYQDAMWTDEPFLYHARLSSALNMKLISPRVCVDAAVSAYHAGHAQLPAVEGFIRQIIGWREFMRGIYFLKGESYAQSNTLGADAHLPEMYWSGETDMRCMQQVIGHVRSYGYAHHIQRLMVTGNFALLAGISPQETDDWYLGMYVDGLEWVTTPNTVGMALYADGGIVGSKPYAASGKYIKKMSNYCQSCRYKVTKRVGEDACPFNTLYWAFLDRHEKTFRQHPRMALIIKSLERLSDAERRRIRTEADVLVDRLCRTRQGPADTAQAV